MRVEGTHDNVFVPLLAQYCQKLQSISISETSNVTHTQLLQLAQNCRHIHTIDFYNDKFYTDEFIITLGAGLGSYKNGKVVYNDSSFFAEKK